MGGDDGGRGAAYEVEEVAAKSDSRETAAEVRGQWGSPARRGLRPLPVSGVGVGQAALHPS